MPFINGRYYMNPLFGAALELSIPPVSRRQRRDSTRLSRTRAGPRGHHPKPQQKHRAQKPSETAHQPGSPAQNANRVYNETSGLRPTTTHGREARKTYMTRAPLLPTCLRIEKHLGSWESSHLTNFAPARPVQFRPIRRRSKLTLIPLRLPRALPRARIPQREQPTTIWIMAKTLRHGQQVRSLSVHSVRLWMLRAEEACIIQKRVIKCMCVFTIYTINERG